MSAAVQKTLSAFESATETPPPQDDPEPATAAGLDVPVTDGFSTTIEREARNDDRVVADATTCAGCNGHYTGDGLCDECATQGDLVDAGSRAPGGGR